MRLVKAHIAGAYEDAYLYMGRVILTTVEHTSVSFPIALLAQVVGRVIPDLPFLTEALFRRNDWLDSELFSTLRDSKGIEEVLERGLNSLLAEPVEVSLKELKPREQQLPISTEVILSALFYSQALFISSSNGFFQINCDWSEEGYLTCEKARTRHDGKSLSASARLGAVSISCGSDGLFTDFDVFDWSFSSKSGSPRRVSDSSLRTTWMGGNLVNYRDSRNPELLRAEKTSGSGRSKPVITDFYSHHVELNSIARSSGLQNSVSPITFSYFSDGIGFQQTASNECVSFEMSLPTKKGAVTRVKSSRPSPQVEGRIITAHRSGAGLILETTKGVYLLDESRVETLHEGRVISIRAFVDSKHYQNLVTIVIEDGVIIIAIVPA